MQAIFYNFRKRINSTKRPAGGGTAADIYLKSESDITAPVIEMQGAAFKGYNYVYIEFFSRYYFINEVRSIASGAYELTLAVDHMGTYGAELIGQSVMCSMSAAFYDGDNLDDNRVVPKNSYITSTATADIEIFSPHAAIAAAYPIYNYISVISRNGLLNGMDVFVSRDNIGRALFNTLTDETWLAQFTRDLTGADPYQMILGAWCSPLIPGQCHEVNSDHTGHIYDDFQIRGAAIASADVKRHDTAFDIPRPTNRDFRYSEKYVKYVCNIPFIGKVNIPTDLLKHAESLRVSYAGDCLTGQYSIGLKAGGENIGIFGTSLKAELPLSGQSSRTAQVITSVLSGAASGAGTGAMAGGWGAAIGAINGGLAGAINGVATPVRNTVVSSSAGGMSLCGTRYNTGELSLVMIEGDSNIDPATLAAVAGRPTQKVITISSGCGYVQAVNASVSISGLMSEEEAVNSILNGGAYFE